ncbi:acyl-CoA dehydrogenase family protein [Frankia nepalensis]|uniref:acyl-CoA dehydrogenase family protein n=1 Tax=Frankia nepalensis TaxID=1836974 RepID=UPI0027DC43E1|nr:acyl-CoA dehydrogenase family protein [Frankia nepalensis]
MGVRLFPEISGEQRLMLDSVIRLVESNCPLPVVRRQAEQNRLGDADLRREFADLGCFGLLVHEDHGGGSLSGNGVVDAALVASERGARLQPGPFVGTNVVAYALSEAGTTPGLEALADLVAGKASAVWAFDGALVGDRRSVLAVRQDGDELVLDGTVCGVQGADECDWILVSALSSDGPVQVLVANPTGGMTLERVDGMDITRRFSDIHFSSVRVPARQRLGGSADAEGLLNRQLAVACVLSAAESVGAMDANFQLALEYSRVRIAFGRPIGSFQAVKHLLANTSLLLEMAKAVVAGAAVKLGAGAPDGPALASIAKAFVGERAVELTHNCFQVFGGIGYTWEHDQHLFMRRLASESFLYGSPVAHRRSLWSHADVSTGARTGERTGGRVDA